MESSHDSHADKGGIPVAESTNKSCHSGIRAEHHNRARKGRAQPRFYPVTKDEPVGQFTQDMLRKVKYIFSNHLGKIFVQSKRINKCKIAV
jgi:hypothetical protein